MAMNIKKVKDGFMMGSTVHYKNQEDEKSTFRRTFLAGVHLGRHSKHGQRQMRATCSVKLVKVLRQTGEKRFNK